MSRIEKWSKEPSVGSRMRHSFSLIMTPKKLILLFPIPDAPGVFVARLSGSSHRSPEEATSYVLDFSDHLR